MPLYFSVGHLLFYVLFFSLPLCRLCILRVVLPLQMLTRIKTIILLCLYAGNTHTHKGSLCAELGVWILHSTLSPLRAEENWGLILTLWNEFTALFLWPKGGSEAPPILTSKSTCKSCHNLPFISFIYIFSIVLTFPTNRNSLHRLMLLLGKTQYLNPEKH